MLLTVQKIGLRFAVFRRPDFRPRFLSIVPFILPQAEKFHPKPVDPAQQLHLVVYSEPTKEGNFHAVRRGERDRALSGPQNRSKSGTRRAEFLN